MTRCLHIPWLRFRNPPDGTVYLLRSFSEPRLFKVGFTSRRTKDRRGELNRVAGDDMRIVYTVSLPHALAVETLTLRSIRRNPFRRRDRRGTECFWLGRRESIERIIRKIDRAAWHVRFMARVRLSWPRGAAMKRFRAAQNQKAV